MKYFNEDELGLAIYNFYENRYGLNTDIATLICEEDLRKIKTIKYWTDEAVMLVDEFCCSLEDYSTLIFVFKFLCHEDWIDFLTYLYEDCVANYYETGYFIPDEYENLFSSQEW